MKDKIHKLEEKTIWKRLEKEETKMNVSNQEYKITWNQEILDLIYKFYEKDFSDIKPSSYNQEIDLFIKNLKENKNCSPSISDALEVMRMIKFIYENN